MTGVQTCALPILAVLSAGAPSAASIIGALTQVPHRHRSLTQNFLPPYSVTPLLQWVRLARWPETAENGAVFLRALMKGKELHVLKPLNLNRFRVSFPGKIASVWLYCGIRGRQNEPPDLEFRPEAKILKRLKLFRLVVTGFGRLQQVAQTWRADS